MSARRVGEDYAYKGMIAKCFGKANTLTECLSKRQEMIEVLLTLPSESLPDSSSVEAPRDEKGDDHSDAKHGR